MVLGEEGWKRTIRRGEVEHEALSLKVTVFWLKFCCGVEKNPFLFLTCTGMVGSAPPLVPYPVFKDVAPFLLYKTDSLCSYSWISPLSVIDMTSVIHCVSTGNTV